MADNKPEANQSPFLSLLIRSLGSMNINWRVLRDGMLISLAYTKQISRDPGGWWSRGAAWDWDYTGWAGLFLPLSCFTCLSSQALLCISAFPTELTRSKQHLQPAATSGQLSGISSGSASKMTLCAGSHFRRQIRGCHLNIAELAHIFNLTCWSNRWVSAQHCRLVQGPSEDCVAEGSDYHYWFQASLHAKERKWKRGCKSQDNNTSWSAKVFQMCLMQWNEVAEKSFLFFFSANLLLFFKAWSKHLFITTFLQKGFFKNATFVD